MPLFKLISDVYRRNSVEKVGDGDVEKSPNHLKYD